LRDHSIEFRARRIDANYETGPKQIPDGAQRYAALCVGCHLAPGVTKSDLRKGTVPASVQSCSRRHPRLP
jgi:cytochrome c553